ncbi:MAG: hypothetical protein JXB25_10395 [Deltaproteobacteria bacterium]|nr:hypothetical protein [Deltaproteobacteria bacterium]
MTEEQRERRTGDRRVTPHRSRWEERRSGFDRRGDGRGGPVMNFLYWLSSSRALLALMAMLLMLFLLADLSGVFQSLRETGWDFGAAGQRLLRSGGIMSLVFRCAMAALLLGLIWKFRRYREIVFLTVIMAVAYAVLVFGGLF